MAENLKLFNEHSEYGSFIQTEGFVRPNVSYCIEENEVHYNPIPNYAKQYLTYVALEDNETFYYYFSSNTAQTISISLDNGETWEQYSSSYTDNGTTLATLDSGEKMLVKGNSVLQFTFGDPPKIKSTGDYSVEGNLMSLTRGDNFIGVTQLENNEEFENLFGGTNLISAKNLILPATTLIQGCYNRMFEGCTSLTEAPQLPATTLANYCYAYMFKGCTNLTEEAVVPSSITPIASIYCDHMYCNAGTTSTGSYHIDAYDCTEVEA